MKKQDLITAIFAIIFFQMLCFNSNASNLKDGWDENLLTSTTEGCTAAVLNPQIEEFNKRSNYKGDGIPPELEKILPGLKKEFSTMCRCIIEQTAKKWSFQEYSKVSDKEKQSFVDEIFYTKKCKIAFDAPIDTQNNIK